MAIVSLGLESLTDLITKDWESDGVFPISLNELKEHENFVEILAVLNKLDSNFNQENVFCVEVKALTAMKVYGFRLHLKNGVPVLDFGASEGINEVPVTVEKRIIQQADPENDIEEEYRFELKAGKVLIECYKGQNDVPQFQLKIGSGANTVTIPFYVKLASEETKYQDFAVLETTDQLCQLVGVMGVMSVKLTDLVRQQVRNGCKGNLPVPIVATVNSWELMPPNPDHPDFGVSYRVNISGIESALDKDGQEIKNPASVWIGDNQPSGKLLGGKKFNDQAILYFYYGGSLQLLITAVAKKEPEKYMPSNVLRLIKPSNPAQFLGLEKALAFMKANPTISVDQIPAIIAKQTALPPSNATTVAPEVQTPEHQKELATVGAAPTKTADVADIYPEGF